MLVVQNVPTSKLTKIYVFRFNRDTRKKIDKTILESICHPKLTSSSRYVVGIIKNGAVHLTSLKSVVQMKPTLPFLNKADKARDKYGTGLT